MDADGHVMEPAGMWQSHIAPAFRERGPRLVRGDDGRTRITVDGRICPPLAGNNSISLAMREAFSSRTREAMSQYADYSAATQIRAMDDGGVDLAFLYPTQGLYTASIDDLDPGLAIAICRAYNEWILEFCAHDPARLRPVAMLDREIGRAHV